MRRTAGSKPVFLIILVWMCLCNPADAIGQAFRFRHLSIDDGLSQNMITAICQDHRGFMWFGTRDGLNRYDGYSFRIYKADAYNARAISDNYITAVYEDPAGNLWIGTMYGGLQLYDREEDNFIKINGKNFPPEARYISSLTGDARNGLIISFLSGHILSFETRESKEITSETIFRCNTVITQGKDELQIPVNAILAPDGLLWISGKKGYSTYDLRKKESVNSWQSYPTYVREYRNNLPSERRRDDSFSPFLTSVQDLQWDDEGVFWMNSVEGLYELHPKRKEVVLYRFARGIYSFLPIRGKGGEKLILADSDSDKLLLFNPATGAVKKLDVTRADDKEIADARFSVMKKSRDGSIWLGSNGRGIFFSHPYLSLFEKGAVQYADRQNLASGSVYSILQRRSGINGNEQILFSTLYSFGQQDISADRSITTYHSPRLRTRALSEDSRGNIWLGSPDGLVKYNPESHSEKLMAPLENSMIMSICTDSSGVVWFSSFSTLFSFDPSDHTLKKFPILPEGNDKLITLHYSTIYPDADKSLWIGTAAGLFHFLPREGKYDRVYHNDAQNPLSLSSDEIKCIRADPRQPEKYLWVGTPTGLNRLDKTAGTFLHFTTEDGLPNNTVYGILDGQDGNLWLSTNRGLSLFDTRAGTFINFDVDNGLQSNEFNTGSYFKSRDGELFFAGINGYNRFYPENIIPGLQAVPMVISNAELVGAGKAHPALSGKSRNLLRYDQNNISLTLASLDYSASDKIAYAYRIANRDTSWINIGRNRNILLTNLSPGSYVFQGRGTDGLGRWNGQIVEMTFTVSPPWWRSPLAYFLYAAAFLTALLLVWRWYKNRLVLQQNLENERKQAQAVLEMDRIKSRFLANITHEFRTPLTLINGHLEQLKDGSPGIPADDRYKEIEQNSHQLLSLINQLLDLSKIESGAYQIRYKAKDLELETRVLTLSFSSLASQKNIRLGFDSGSFPASQKIIYDEDIVRTILTNLLSNAVRFTPPYGNIDVSLAYEASGREIKIAVSDSGAGIPEEEQSRIFDRFYQSGNQEKSSHGGSGIGLSLVRELALLHGGSISVESEPEKGSCFTVILKEGASATDHVHPGESALYQYPTETPSENPAIGNSDESPVILIAEDHDELRRFIIDSLGNDYRYLETSGGIEALEMAAGQVPDLIISDVMMPGMDGLALCEKIKAGDATSHIPFILLTARADQEDKMAGLENGADEYLTKPFSVNELRVRVKNMLRNRKLLQERYQASFLRGNEETTKENTYLKKVEEVVRNHASDYLFGVERLAEEMSLSTAQLNRKIKAVTGHTTVIFIQNVRIQMALQLLRQGEKNIAEIAYSTGFENPGYFSKVFKKHLGFSPSERENMKD